MNTLFLEEPWCILLKDWLQWVLIWPAWWHFGWFFMFVLILRWTGDPTLLESHTTHPQPSTELNEYAVENAWMNMSDWTACSAARWWLALLFITARSWMQIQYSIHSIMMDVSPCPTSAPPASYEFCPPQHQQDGISSKHGRCSMSVFPWVCQPTLVWLEGEKKNWCHLLKTQIWSTQSKFLYLGKLCRSPESAMLTVSYLWEAAAALSSHVW